MAIKEELKVHTEKKLARLEARARRKGRKATKKPSEKSEEKYQEAAARAGKYKTNLEKQQEVSEYDEPKMVFGAKGKTWKERPYGVTGKEQRESKRHYRSASRLEAKSKRFVKKQDKRLKKQAENFIIPAFIPSLNR
jgi:hypothetical protein